MEKLIGIRVNREYMKKKNEFSMKFNKTKNDFKKGNEYYVPLCYFYITK